MSNQLNAVAMQRYFPAFAPQNNAASKFVPLFPDTSDEKVRAWRIMGGAYTRLVDAVPYLKPFEKSKEPLDEFYRNRAYSGRLGIGYPYDPTNTDRVIEMLDDKGELVENTSDSGIAVQTQHMILNAFNNFPVETPGSVWIQHQVFMEMEYYARIDYTFLLWLPYGDKPPDIGDVCYPNFPGIGDAGKRFHWVHLLDTPTPEIQDKLDETRDKKRNEKQLVENGARMNELLEKINPDVKAADPAIIALITATQEQNKLLGQLLIGKTEAEPEKPKAKAKEGTPA